MSEEGSQSETSAPAAPPPTEVLPDASRADTAEQQPTANGSADTEAASGADEEPVEEPWKKRLWFVRLPQPEQVSAGGLTAQLDSLKDQVKLLNASSLVKRLERDQVQTLHKQAREQLLICKENLLAKDEQLRPLREARDQRNKAQDALRSGGQVTIRSEEELDAKLTELHHRQQHESLTVAEEKRLLADIKTLQGSREKVKEYAAKASSLAEARDAMSSIQGDMRALETERKALLEEKQVQSKITDKYWHEQQELDSQIEDIFKERRRIKDLQDEQYAELRIVQQAARDRGGAFSQNRAFSKEVRNLVRSGQLDEARSLCDQQMDEQIERLSTDTEARAEYQALWEQQRPKQLDLPVGVVSSQGKLEEVQQPARSKAEELVNNLLANLKKSRSQGNIESQSASNPQAVPSAKYIPPKAKPSPSATPALPPKPTVSKAAPAPASTEEHAYANGDSAAPKATGRSKRSESEDFEVPASLKKSEPALDEAQLKEQARQHSMAAAREAEARKQRRQQDKERKQQQAAARAQDAKPKPKAPTAEPIANGVHSPPERPQSPTEPVIPSHDFLLAAAEEAKAPALARDSAQKRKAGSISKGPKLAPNPPRARPPVRKKGLAKIWNDYQYWLMAGSATLVSAGVGLYAYGFGSA